MYYIKEVTETKEKNMDIKDIAKSIRTVLKSTFPATKFSVTTSRFSQGSSADVSWADGPTKTQVNDLIDLHGTRSQFINTDRIQSVKLASKAVEAWKAQNPEYAHITVDCKGEVNCYGIELSGFNTKDNIGLCEDSVNEFVRNASFPTVNLILATAATKQEKVLASQPQPTSQPSQLDALEAELAQADKELAQAVKTIRELKGRTAELRVKIKLASTPKQKDANVKLYFDANYVCLGGSADDWGMPNYSGDYVHTNSVRLAYGFNPVGKTEVGLLVTCRHYVLMKRPVAVS